MPISRVLLSFSGRGRGGDRGKNNLLISMINFVWKFKTFPLNNTFFQEVEVVEAANVISTANPAMIKRKLLQNFICQWFNNYHNFTLQKILIYAYLNDPAKGFRISLIFAIPKPL